MQLVNVLFHLPTRCQPNKNEGICLRKERLYGRHLIGCYVLSYCRADGVTYHMPVSCLGHEIGPILFANIMMVTMKETLAVRTDKANLSIDKLHPLHLSLSP
jgi:hypothetical protein